MLVADKNRYSSASIGNLSASLEEGEKQRHEHQQVHSIWLVWVRQWPGILLSTWKAVFDACSLSSIFYVNSNHVMAHTYKLQQAHKYINGYT